jgi:hypothetical protein
MKATMNESHIRWDQIQLKVHQNAIQVEDLGAFDFIMKALDCEDVLIITIV